MILFRLTAWVGFLASAVAFGGILGVPLLTMTYAMAQLLSRFFLVLAMIGPVTSVASLYLGRQRGFTFREHKRTVIAAYAGVALPTILVLLWVF